MSRAKITHRYEFKVQCPVCGKMENITVTDEDFENSLTGLVRIPVEHPEPFPHIIIVDVDSHGFIRGAYLYKKITRGRKINITEILDNFEVEQLARILYFILSKTRIRLEGTKKKIELITRLIEILGEKNKLSPQGEKLNVDNPPKPKAPLHVLRQIIFQARRLPTEDAKYEWIQAEYQRIRSAIEEVMILIQNNKKWKLDELTKKVEKITNKDEARFIIDLLDQLGYKASKKVIDKEYRVKDLFI